MVLFSDQDACNEINETRIKKVFNDYCKIQNTFNGRIKVSDFLEQTNDLLTITQFEEILKHMSISLKLENIPGEINYHQFKEFVESMMVFALMDRDDNRSLSPREVKLFVEFMGKYRASDSSSEEVKRFLIITTKMVMEKSQFMNSCWQNTGPHKNTIKLKIWSCLVVFLGKK